MVSPSLFPTTTQKQLPQGGVELADVVRQFGAAYRSQYGHVMMPSQKRALSDIEACCTKQLGGRLYRCDDCSESFWRFSNFRSRQMRSDSVSKSQLSRLAFRKLSMLAVSWCSLAFREAQALIEAGKS